MVSYIVFKINKVISIHKTLTTAKAKAKSEAERTKTPHTILKSIGVFTGEKPSKFK